MRISVVLCSYGRPDILDDTVQSVLRQTVVPEDILIVCPSADHVHARTLERKNVRLLLSPRGLTLQRTTALDNIGDCDLVAFFDDDMELCPSYLANMVHLFSGDPEIVVASGQMLADGGRGEQVLREHAKTLCDNAELRINELGTISTRPLDYGYGCNLIVRASAAQQNRFDERLSLYAWLEDSDYSHRCTRGQKRPVINLSAQCVHLGWRGGRISGRKMGYSQIVNPIYLWRKARVFSLRHLFIQYWMRCFVANCFGLIWGKPEEDRLERLKGNIIAFRHLLVGRCDPMLINRLS